MRVDQVNIIHSTFSEDHKNKSMKHHIANDTPVNKSAWADLFFGEFRYTKIVTISAEIAGSKWE
jgi:hypothetical protein